MFQEIRSVQEREYVLTHQSLTSSSSKSSKQFHTSNQNCDQSLYTDWPNVTQNIQAMDRRYDASFYSWIKSEDNIHLAAGHIKRIMVEYTTDRVINGLSWLISDWTLGSITQLLKKIIFEDIWKTEEPTSCLPKSRSSTKRKSICLEDLEALHSLALFPPTECLTLSDGSVYAISLYQFERAVTITLGLVQGWSINFIAGLVSDILSGMDTKPQRHFFLQKLTAEWDFSRLSELFLYLNGNLVEWKMKLSLLKRFSSQASCGKSLKKFPSDETCEFRTRKLNCSDASIEINLNGLLFEDISNSGSSLSAISTSGKLNYSQTQAKIF